MNGPLHSNVTFRTLDATKLDYPPNSFDLIFFSWLLAYLSDEEVRQCAGTLLRYIHYILMSDDQCRIFGLNVANDSVNVLTSYL